MLARWNGIWIFDNETSWLKLHSNKIKVRPSYKLIQKQAVWSQEVQHFSILSNSKMYSSYKHDKQLCILCLDFLGDPS